MNAGAFALYSNRWEQPQAIDFSRGSGLKFKSWGYASLGRGDLSLVISTNREKSLEYEVFLFFGARLSLPSAPDGREVNASRDVSLSLRSQIWNYLKSQI